MKYSSIFVLGAVILGLIGTAAGEEIEIFFRTLGDIDDKYSLYWDVDRYFVRDIAKLYCKKRACKEGDKLRVENSLGRVYEMNKTLREAGIQEVEMFFVKQSIIQNRYLFSQ